MLLSPEQAKMMRELQRRMVTWPTIEIIEVPPSNLKKFVTGKGNAKKDEMRLGVFKKWRKEFITEHEIDAYGLAKIAEAVMNPSDGLTKPQQEVVKKLQLQLTASKPNSKTLEMEHGSSKKCADSSITARPGEP